MGNYIRVAVPKSRSSSLVMVGLRSVLMWDHLLFLLDLNQCLFIAAPFFVMYTFSFRPCRSWLDPLGVHRRTAMWCWLCGVGYKDPCREGCDPDFPPCFDKLSIHVLTGETLRGAATVQYASLMKETADRDSPSVLRVTAVVLLNRVTAVVPEEYAIETRLIRDNLC